jgi:hypothetical protein
VIAPIVFDGSGTATRTTTSSSGGSTAETDRFSWHMVDDVDVTALRHESFRAGWTHLSQGTWNKKKSTFTGTTTASCTPPSGGTCVMPGGGTSCQATFTNDPGLPASDYGLSVHGPVDDGVAKILVPAHVVSRVRSGPSGCGPLALDNTCDPYNKRYGLPPSGDILATFHLDLDEPNDTAPVSTNHKATCSGATYHTHWTGTIKVGGSCKVPGRTLAAADGGLQVLTDPEPGSPVASFKSSVVTVTTRAFCGKPPYRFRWQIAYTEQNRTREEPSPYVTVKPPLKDDRPGPTSRLKLRLKCSFSPKVRRMSPESWLPCWSFVKYLVTVTDAAGQRARGSVLFNWQAQCIPKASRPLIKKQIDDITKEIQDALSAKEGVKIALKTLLHYLLEAEGAPAAFVVEMAELGQHYIELQGKIEELQAELDSPIC